MEIHLVDQDYATVLHQLAIARRRQTDMIEKVRNPAHIGTITIRQGLQREIGAADTEEILVAQGIGEQLVWGASNSLRIETTSEYRFGSWLRKRGIQTDNGTIVTASSKRPATRE